MTEDAQKRLMRLAELADQNEVDRSGDVFDDPRWDEVAAGRASAETRAELARRAAEAGAPEAMEVFAPLPKRVERNVLVAIEAASEEAPARERSDRAVVVPLRPILAGLAVVMAIAALAVVWLAPPDEQVASTWPRYEVTLEGGQRVMRDEAGPTSHRPGGPVIALLRPERVAEATPSVRAFVLAPERVVHLVGETEIAASGAVRFRARLPGDLAAGEHALWFFVGAAEALPAIDASRAELEASELSPVTATLSIEAEPRGP